MMHVLVVGAGLGGLATATLLARGGARVTLRERALHPGGRARSTDAAGARINLGPHALYRVGPAAALLRELGVPLHGAIPPLSGRALRGGRLHDLPATPWSLFATSALDPREKVAASALLAPWATAPEGTVDDWLAEQPEGAADLVRAAMRVATYCNAPHLLSARRALAQLRAAQRGVLYLDGGWQTLVDALVQRATEARVRVDLGTAVERAATEGHDAVVVAGTPASARGLGLPVPELVPVRAACLDVVLEALPVPENRFVLGLDVPMYLAEHGGVAALGGVVLHAARYLAPGEIGDEHQLEALLDHAQPGWRATVRWRRFLPAIEVAGRVDRPGERVPDRLGGAWVVGDWVGEEGMLLDRTMASARRVAAAILGGEAARVPPGDVPLSRRAGAA
jgi:glycine/D-amino acid oxidase-like deaminating enzyme